MKLSDLSENGKTSQKSEKKVGVSKAKKTFARLNYAKGNVELALKEIKKVCSVSVTDRKYSIPESTLRAKKNNKYADKKPGPAAVLSTTEEKDLVDWIFNCSR